MTEDDYSKQMSDGVASLVDTAISHGEQRERARVLRLVDACQDPEILKFLRAAIESGEEPEGKP